MFSIAATFIIILLSTLLTVSLKTAPDRSLPLGTRQADGLDSASTHLRRGYHASAVINGHVYIDGGEFSYRNNNGDIVYQYSDSLLSIDLTQDWSNDAPPIQSLPKPSGVPNLNDGGIWVHRAKGELYTGFAGTNPTFGDQAFSPQGLWSFNPSKSSAGSWTCLNGSVDPWFTSEPRPYKAQVASGHNYGFISGGTSGNSSSSSTQRTSSSFVRYNMSDERVSLTGGGFGPTAREVPSSNGTIHVPNWGTSGIVLAVGGSDMRTAHVYDFDQDRWYSQNTTGDVPEIRRDFCIAGAPSNNHTFEILVYGGWKGKAGPDTVRFDTVHVLTLPGFNWFQVNYTAAHPRHSLTCNYVGGGQVLITGGVDPTQQAGNGSSEHAAGFSTPDPNPNGLSIFDLSKMVWSSIFRAKRPLQRPAVVVQAYYNAHPTPSPPLQQALQTLFSPSNYHSAPEDDPLALPSSTPSTITPDGDDDGSRKGPSTAAIIGLSIGAIVFTALAIAAAILLRFKWKWRLRRRREEVEAGDQVGGMQQVIDDAGGGGLDGNGGERMSGNSGQRGRGYSGVTPYTVAEENEEVLMRDAAATLAGSGRLSWDAGRRISGVNGRGRRDSGFSWTIPEETEEDLERDAAAAAAPTVASGGRLSGGLGLEEADPVTAETYRGVMRVGSSGARARRSSSFGDAAATVAGAAGVAPGPWAEPATGGWATTYPRRPIAGDWFGAYQQPQQINDPDDSSPRGCRLGCICGRCEHGHGFLGHIGCEACGCGHSTRPRVQLANLASKPRTVAEEPALVPHYRESMANDNPFDDGQSQELSQHYTF